MHIKKPLLFLLLSLSILSLAHPFKTNAQGFVCRDSSVINRYQYCDTTWAPVCGCDNHTYRNICEAYSHNGIITYNDRACEDVTLVHFWPNAVQTTANFRVYLKDQGDLFCYIYDMAGNVYYYRYFYNAYDLTEVVDLSQLKNGMYVFIALANGHFAATKFVKIPY